jgi:hypothetical protein
MARPESEPGGTCPGCKTGKLVKHKMTKLECEGCGWETIVDPNESNVFMKPQGSGKLELFCLLCVLLVILLVLYGDKLSP